MIKHCSGCFALRQPMATRFLCNNCYGSLIAANRPPVGEALYGYMQLMRRLILRTKVYGDHRALSTLVDLFVNHPVTQEAAHDCHQVMAAPSSLWGRIRGRIDLAAQLAAACARQYHKPFRLSPGHLYWRLHKRARSRHKAHVNWQPVSQDQDESILLVDDIVTTGYTLSQVAPCLTDYNLRILSLAHASSS